MSELTLYDFADNWIALLNSLDTCKTPEERAECEAKLAQAKHELLHKTDNFCRFLTHLDSQIQLAANEIDRLKTRQRIFEHAQQRLEEYAVSVMQQLELKKLQGDTSQLSLRQNGSAVQITDLSLVPGEFTTIEHKVIPDKRAIKKAIENGRDVPGADLRFGTVSLVRK